MLHVEKLWVTDRAAARVALGAENDGFAAAAREIVRESDGDGYSTTLMDQALEFLHHGRVIPAMLGVAIQAEFVSEEMCAPARVTFARMAKMVIESVLLIGDKEQKDYLGALAREAAIVVRKWTIVSIELGTAPAIVHTLKVLQYKLVGNKCILTPFLSCLVQICAMTRLYSAAYEVVKDMHIMEINAVEHGLTPRDYLEYFHYSGTVCVAMEDFEVAMIHFKQCYLAPSRDVSEIALDAFKKATLLELILRGKKLAAPSYMPEALSRWVENTFSHFDGYAHIMEAFDKEDGISLAAAIAQHEGVFTTDGNMGLVLRLPLALKRGAIRKLTSTYITLPLSDIAKQVGLSSVADAEDLVVKMIADKEVEARIDHVNMMVRFGDGLTGDAMTMSTKEMDVLEERLRQAYETSERLRQVQIEVMASKEYIRGTMST